MVISLEIYLKGGVSISKCIIFSKETFHWLKRVFPMCVTMNCKFLLKQSGFLHFKMVKVKIIISKLDKFYFKIKTNMISKGTSCYF